MENTLSNVGMMLLTLVEHTTSMTAYGENPSIIMAWDCELTSTITDGIQLSVCSPVLKMKCTDLHIHWICPQMVDGIVVG